MARPSQCPACGCFEACIFPGTQGCAETDDSEEDAIAAAYWRQGITGLNER